MEPADLVPFSHKEVAHQTAAREGMFQIQLVEPVHDRKIGSRHWTRQMIDAAPAHAEGLGLLP
jgi:hypothetical protein